MTPATSPPARPDVVIYPDSDGLPMADNTLQFRWIVTLQGNLAALYRDDPNVFVAGDLLWYPVEGEPEVRAAPDVMVAFGRPKGDRGSYRQWEEGHVAPQVVFEVLSPGNDSAEMIDKSFFYEEHGVEEYYVYDPEKNTLIGSRRLGGGALKKVRPIDGWVSPRLGIRFDLSGPEMKVYGPDGKPFLTFEELVAQRNQEQQAREAAEQAAEQARQAEGEARQAEAEARRLETEARQRAEKLAAQLRALGVEPEA